MNAAELLDLLTSLGLAAPARAQGGAARAVTVEPGIEVGQAAQAGEKPLRTQWRKRVATTAVRYLLVADDPNRPGSVLALGPSTHEAPVRSLDTKALFDRLESIASSTLPQVEATRQLTEAVSLLDQTGIAGVDVRKLLTIHTLGARLRNDSARWPEMSSLVEPVTSRDDWRNILDRLGYDLSRRDTRGYLARCGGRPIAVIHPKQDASEFSRLDREGRPPEGILTSDCRSEGARYGILAHRGRFRLFDAESQNSTAEWLDINARWVNEEYRPLLALLSPKYLAEGGLAKLREESQAFGSRLHKDLDQRIRQKALPALATGIQNWARGAIDLTNDEQRQECERAALTLLFRLLFVLYAESSGFLPIDNYSYRGVALSTLVEEAAAKQEQLSPASTALWDRFVTLVKAMRNGNPAWGVPAYNGALFAQSEFEGAELLERLEISDPEFGAVLTAVGHDPATGSGADFSTLELGHLGHIYEALLSLRLSIADRPLVYDPKKDRYRPVDVDGDVEDGELLWRTNEGGRKAGGVYYTPTSLVRHLIRHAVMPAFERHLKEVEQMSNRDPAGAAEKLFDFTVLDPACGSGHFLVQVVEALAERSVRFLADNPLPEVTTKINGLREVASRGVVIDDVSLLRRLILKACVFGVDISPMGTEIAALSLWLVSFVPGLSLSYLKRNVIVGNSLIGVDNPAIIGSRNSLWDDTLHSALQQATNSVVRLRKIDDRNPEEVAESKKADQEAQTATQGIARLFDLWTAGGFGLDEMRGSRNAVETKPNEIISGKVDDNVLQLIKRSISLSNKHRFLHWPVDFPYIFLRKNPGFDAVISNPPWKEITVEKRAFFAMYKPGITNLSHKEYEKAIEDILAEQPEILIQYQSEQKRTKIERRALSSMGYESMRGDPDLYKYFVNRYRMLVRDSGYIGVVLPRESMINKGLESFRKWLFQQSTVHRIDYLKNEKRWIFDIATSKHIALISIERSNPRPDHKVEVAGIAKSLSEWLIQATNQGIQTSPQVFGPGWIIPILRSETDEYLLSKLQVGNRFPFGINRTDHYTRHDTTRHDTTRHLPFHRSPRNTRSTPLGHGSAFQSENWTKPWTSICGRSRHGTVATMER